MPIQDIRYKALGYVALNVIDLPRSLEFYRDKVGLTVTESSDGALGFLRCSDRHHDLLLSQGEKPGLKRLGWEMENAGALAAARAHLSDIGIAVEPVAADEAALLGFGDGFRFEEPTTGTTFEFFCDFERASSSFAPTHTKIARLGHIVLNSTNRLATEAFLVDQLNFRVSDRIEGIVTFMRCFPNPYHHSFGVAQGQAASFHHLNFMVTEMADVGKGNNRMRQADIPIVYGIGKHPPSESVFLYFLDPDGITVEYSFGMEEFPEEGPRQPREMPARLESVDYWGGIPDPRFAKVGEIEHLH